MADTSLDGKVAIVTGAGRGLGRAEALELARQGATVIVNDAGVALDGTDERQPADEVVAEITDLGGTALAHQGDIADWDTAKGLIDLAVEEFGDLHILVNNAGILRDRMIFNMSEQEWDAVVRVHLKGHFCTSRHATAYWRQRSKDTDGPVYARVVNTSSEAYLFGSEGQPNYAAAKAGITSLTVAIARGCARYGVRANAICPRAKTRMTETMLGQAEGEADPLAPERVAPLVAYLSSPAAERISGQVFVVYAGLVLLLAGPKVDERFDAPDGAWTPEQLHDAMGKLFEGREVLEGYQATELMQIGAQSG